MNRIDNIDYCIHYLLQQNHVEADVPTSLVEKQRLLRALMNVWNPQPLSDEFLQAQNAELQAQLQDKGVVEPEGILWQDDITCLKVDAIVNAANSQGLGCWQPLHNCIDNAIHSAAGLQLRQECNEILKGGMIDTGEVIITKGYNLPAKYVIHTVGPIISAGETPTLQQREQLANCYRNSLALAEANSCRSIAFCCISTGVFGYPNSEAAEVAVETVTQAIKQSNIKAIFNVFKDIDYDIYRQLLGTH